jgi:hypothetical protein
VKLGACLGWGNFSKYEFAKKIGLDYGETDFTDLALASEEDFNEFCENIRRIKFIETHNVIAGVIFILEREKGKIDFLISGINS